MASERRFPVMAEYGQTLRRDPSVPRDVPWALVAPYEQRAMENHSQSLATLAARGGLSVCELFYLLRDERWPRSGQPWVTQAEALAYLLGRLVPQTPAGEPEGGRDA